MFVCFVFFDLPKRVIQSLTFAEGKKAGEKLFLGPHGEEARKASTWIIHLVVVTVA